jgi:hypothetical protein
MNTNRLPVLAESAEKLRKIAHEQKNKGIYRRIMALYLVASGQAGSAADVGRILACDPSGVARWFRTYAKEGLAGLLSFKKQGRPLCSALRREDVNVFISKRLSDTSNPPTSFKGLLAEVRAAFPDVAFTYGGFWKAFKAAFPGASLKSPRPQHPKQAEGAVEEFKKNSSRH